MRTNLALRTSRSGPLGGPRSGGVLALAMIVVLTIAALAAGMLQLSGAVTKRQASAVNTKLSFYMAESGLTEAYAGLVAGHTGNVGSEAAPVAFGEGLFWVEATENADGTTTLESTGMIGNGRAVLSFVVERDFSSVASLGVFGVDSLTIGPGVTVDGFDSHVIEEQPAPEGGEQQVGDKTTTPERPPALGRLASNGPITITGTELAPVTIDGNVVAGPSETVQVSGSVAISGATESALAAVPLPPVEVPPHTLDTPVTVSSPTPYTILPGDTALETLVVRGASEAVVEGPATLIVGGLLLEPDAKLTLDSTNGEVRLFVLENLKFEPGSLVETIAEDAGSISMQVPSATARPVVLAATSEFKGVVYAPEASVRVVESFQLYGSIVGKALEFVGAVQLHYDTHLDALAAQTGLPSVVSWRILELSNPSIAVQMDPFRALGVDRNALDAPADAHEDQFIRIKYVALDDSIQTYQGMESGFDWDQVKGTQTLFRDGEEVDVDLAEQRALTKVMDSL